MEFCFKSGDKSDNEKLSSPQDEYPSLAIFIPILEEEYRQEKERTERIDNKAMAFLTIVIALITVYVPIFPFEKIPCTFRHSEPGLELHLLCFFLLLGIIGICIASWSAIKLVSIYAPTEFQAVNIELLNDNKKLSCNPATKFQLNIIDHYQAIILANAKINSQKASILKKQYKYILIIFVFLTISAIGTKICIGI